MEQQVPPVPNAAPKSNKIQVTDDNAQKGRVVRFFGVIRRNPKKSLAVVAAWGFMANYYNNKAINRQLLRAYCKEASSYGDQTIDVLGKNRRVTVIMNRWAADGKARARFEESAMHLLHLSGLQVNIIKADSADQVQNIASAIDTEETDALYVVGGDGTFSKVLTGMLSNGNRSEQSLLPIGVFPGGLASTSAMALLPSSLLVPVIRLQCESALALIRDVTKTATPISVQVDDKPPVIGMSHVHGGAFADANVLRWKYWYYGSLRHRFSYLWNGMKKGVSDITTTIEYTQPCSGCRNCRSTNSSLNQQAESQSPSQRSWLMRLFFGDRPMESKKGKSADNRVIEVDYSKIDNPDCGVVRETQVHTSDLLIHNRPYDSSPSIDVKTSEPDYGRLSLIREGWRRCGADSGVAAADQTEFYANTWTVGSAVLNALQNLSEQARTFYVDGERYVAEHRVVVKALPTRLRVFAASEPLLHLDELAPKSIVIMPTHDPPKILEQLLSQPTDQDAGHQVQQICTALQEAGVKPGENSEDLCKENKNEEASMLSTIDTYFDKVIFWTDPLIREQDTQEKCRWLIAGGMKLKQFEDKVMASDCSARCGCVWEPNTIAFRCRTCAKSQCMSLCVDCFKMADHTNHDYNRFWSQAGGACDCGDEMVMHSQGFCSRHGQKAVENKRKASVNTTNCELVAVASYLFPKLLTRLLCKLRDRFRLLVDLPHNIIEEQMDELFDTVRPLLVFLNDYAVMGGYMRALFSQLFLDKTLYTRICRSLAPPKEAEMLIGVDSANAQSSAAALEMAVKSLESVCNTQDAQLFECKWLSEYDSHETLLDELTFWLTRLEYPQKLVTFMLTILPEDDFKIEFAQRFFAHYARTAELLRIQSHARQRQVAGENLSNRIVHISVQILSGRELCVELASKLPLIRLIIGCVKGILRPNMIDSVLGGRQDENEDDNVMLIDATPAVHRVLSCASNTMEHHQYWPLVTDLHSVVTHPSLAHEFIRDTIALEQWLQVLNSMQGMNCNVRIVRGEHVSRDSRSYYWSYTAELEIGSVIMWCLVKACSSQESADLMYTMMEALMVHLKQWFQIINFHEQASLMSRVHLSFHLPLHRYYAAFLCHACNVLDINCELPADDSTFVMQLAMHPLQISVGRAEVANNMWVRNGHDMRYQAWLYVQSSFCTSFADLDMYLLQMCVSSVQPVDWLVMTILDRFHLRRFLTSTGVVSTYPDAVMRPEWTVPMLEAALRLIAALAANRLNNVMKCTRGCTIEKRGTKLGSPVLYTGLSERDTVVLEVCTLLAMSDRTHSQLKESMPSKGSHDTTFENHLEGVLEQVSSYKEPDVDGGQTQGMHVPKDSLWTHHYDPLFTHLRSMQPTIYAQSLLRFTEFVRKCGLSTNDVWPPYRVPSCAPNNKCSRLLHCRTLHATAFVIIYKFWADTSCVSEDALALVVYLINMAINCVDESQTKLNSYPVESSLPLLHLFNLYPTDSVFSNLCTRVNFTPSEAQIDANPLIVGISEALTSNESILSLLVRIHKRKGDELINKQQSGSDPSDSYDEDNLWSSQVRPSNKYRYEGRNVIDSLLNVIYNTDSDCRRELDRIRASFGRHGTGGRLSTVSVEGVNTDSAAKSLEQRRLQARKRQQQLMAQMNRKGEKLLQKLMADEKEPKTGDDSKTNKRMNEKMEVDEDDKNDVTPSANPDERECVICNVPAKSTYDKPLGLVATCIPNSVVGHMLPEGVQPRDACADVQTIADADDEMQQLTLDQCHLRSHYHQYVKTLYSHYGHSADLDALDPMSGVKVRTCRHYVHISCHTSYLNSLSDVHAHVDMLLINPRLGEYLCPMCRRVSNCVLPIQPPVRPALIQLAVTVQPPIDAESLQLVNTICQQSVQQLRISSDLARANGQFLDSCHASVSAVLPHMTEANNQLLIPALLRYNIEHELMMADASIPQQAKHSTIGELLPVLAERLLYQAGWQLQEQWSELCARSTCDKHNLSIIYVDSIGLLIHLSLLVLANRGCDHDQLCVSLCTLYRLLLHHCCVRACLQLIEVASTSGQCSMQQLVANLSISSPESTYVTQLFKRVIDKVVVRFVDQSDTSSSTGATSTFGTLAQLDSAIRSRVTHFTRIAQCLFNAAGVKLPLAFTDRIEQNEPGDTGSGSAGPTGHVLQLIGSWLVNCDRVFLQSDKTAALTLYNRLAPFNAPMRWQPPRLIQLPHNYDTLFEMYIANKCSRCGKVPKEMLLCLLCGRFLCHSQSSAGKCCQRRAPDASVIDVHKDEAELHIQHCGFGTGILLSVYSSFIFIVRGHRAGVWGSVYLDKHGEEDKQLKRGKPLFLSRARYESLQQQWLSLQPGGSHMRWIWMGNFLQYMDTHD